MPFRKRARVTMTNLSDEELFVYYQVNYTLTEVPEDAAYFHAQFRRTNPLPYKEVYTILDGVKGAGQYVGTYMAWGGTTSAGGARARSSSISTATGSGRPSAARAPRTISAAPTTLTPAGRTARGITRNSRRPTAGCPR